MAFVVCVASSIAGARRRERSRFRQGRRECEEDGDAGGVGFRMAIVPPWVVRVDSPLHIVVVVASWGLDGFKQRDVYYAGVCIVLSCYRREGTGMI